MADSTESSELNVKVVEAKNALMTALGEGGAARYLANMKLWFRCKMTKEEFDCESRKLLKPGEMHLHNNFFKAILNKIDAFYVPPQHLLPPAESSSSRSRKRKRSRTSQELDRATFDPVDLLDFLVEDDMKLIRPPSGTDANLQMLPTQRYCTQELFLPDAGFTLGRFLIGAWEVGLSNVENGVADYVSMAVQVLLKNLVSAIIIKRKHYKVTGEGSFYYDVGAHLRDPSLRNTISRIKVDDSPLELDKEITSPNFLRRPHDEMVFLSACESISPPISNLITLRDAQRAFGDRNLILSHSVYAINMERLTQMMH